eukprot:TRINITY_DN13330_c1_g1_i2.p1 TRINITY_DN13330_c1_g1~~TRINITY_DN13330_c1_g1_i2.p1  ORF type:complete len:608 (+),score=82.48 TRINITY_DN13330_c1_g1_i2:85-1908(+)
MRPRPRPVATDGTGVSASKSSFGLRITLEDFAEFDPNAPLDSPRSLAACDAEGILLQDLRYKPLEKFQTPGLDVRVGQLRYEYLEARRQDLLASVRNTRLAIIDLQEEADRAEQLGIPIEREEGRNPDLHTQLQPSWREGGPPDPNLAGSPTTPYPKALRFFAGVLGEYSVEMAYATSPPMSPSNVLEPYLPPVTAPASPGPSRAHSDTNTRGMLRAASEPEIRGLLNRVRTAPRATRADEEYAFQGNQNHIVNPALWKKARHRAYKEQNRLTNRRVEMATATFDRLILNEQENYEKLQHRNYTHRICQEADVTKSLQATGEPLPTMKGSWGTLMLSKSLKPGSPLGFDKFQTLSGSTPVSPGSVSFGDLGDTLLPPNDIPFTTSMGSSKGFRDTFGSTSSRVSNKERQAAARQKNLQMSTDFETHRTKILANSVSSWQSLKDSLCADAEGEKWKIAHRLLEDRVRWRASYNKVATMNEYTEAFRRDFFVRREERQRGMSSNCDDCANMRKEIRAIRDLNRILNHEQRDRKDAWRHNKKMRMSAEKKAEVAANSTLILSPKFGSGPASPTSPMSTMSTMKSQPMSPSKGALGLPQTANFKGTFEKVY